MKCCSPGPVGAAAATMSDVTDDTDDVSSTGMSSYIMLSFMHVALGKSNVGDLSLENPDTDELQFENPVIWELFAGM